MRAAPVVVAATIDDLDAIMELETASFVSDAWSRELMADELASAHNDYFVVAVDGQLLGYAGLRAPSGAREADVQTIAVAVDARGRGIGRLLMEALLETARQRRMREVFLEVRADNPVARSLYESLGFAELGIRVRYYQPDGVDAVVMRLALAPSAPTDPTGGAA